ncbi:hypothetical protein FHX08_001101 [Rhizobium sp. BK529]|nr:hypothetical protein [Rhizobium sp. BK529]
MSEEQQYSDADLVVRGRMKLVTYGVELPAPKGERRHQG